MNMLTLEQIKDLIAYEFYRWEWYMLLDHQKARLVDKVAERWADETRRNLTEGHLIEAA